MKIILVAGKAGSGKNEVARLIKEYYLYQKKECAITSYSKYIKNFAMELSDWDGNDNTKPRKFLQSLGDSIRDYDVDYFPNHVIRDIPIYEKYVSALVISDVRMPNEIDILKNSYNDVYAFYVVNQFGQSKLSLEEQSHITETALESYPDFDYIIANDTHENLRNKIFSIMEEINRE